MDFTELPFSVLLLQLLEFLPLGSAPCIAAAAHFPDVPAKSFCEYVSTIKRACLQKLRPLLELGFNAPCLSFRHQPALRDGDVEASVCRLAASYLGLPALGPAAGAFQRFLAQDGFVRCTLLHRVVAAPLQCQVARFLSVFVLLAFQISFLFLVPHSTGE